VPEKQRAYFDGPIRALRCGAAIAKAAGASFGVHTGQVIRRGTAVVGTAFDVAETIAAQAPPGQAWASRVLVDLVPGSDLLFAETGVAVPAQDREIVLLSVQAQS
jgi:class 3 adenylate cyclase